MVAWPTSRPTLLIVMAVGLAARTTLGADRTTPSVAETISPLQATFQGMTGDELFAKLLEHNQIRDAQLRQYRARRTYEVTNDKGKLYAQVVVRVDYQAPDHKSFHTESEEGSGLVRNMVLKRLIESESDTSSGRAHHDSAIKPANYEFNLLGEQDIGPYHCLVAEATPKRKDKYLFEGRVWIDAQDYAIVRIAGQPAKSFSFWNHPRRLRAPVSENRRLLASCQGRDMVHVRLYGKKILTIDHRDYAINGGTGGSTQDLTAQNRASEP
jgi:hypothetical protein